MSEREGNGYSVHAAEGGGGWEVQIVDPATRVVSTRHCVDQAEARTFASTVQQHIYWLTPGKFREYYRLPETGS